MKWFIKCLKQYADFNGRARRKEYWWFILIYFIIALICIFGWMMPFFKMGYEAGISGGAINIDEQEAALAMMKNPFLYIYIVFYMAMLIPSVAVTVRRLHDIGKSGYWAFFVFSGSILYFISKMLQVTNLAFSLVLALVCMAIAIISLVWMFTNSQYGPNKYGPNPKGEGNDETPVAE